MKELQTLKDLKDYLNSLSEKQLKHVVQVIKPSPFELKELMPGLSIGTVKELELGGSRSCVDNKYHANEIVILVDYNPFGEDGAIAYEMNPLKKGKRKVNILDMKSNPIYGKLGKTKKKDQYAAKRKVYKDQLPKAEIALIKNRVKGYKLDPPV